MDAGCQPGPDEKQSETAEIVCAKFISQDSIERKSRPRSSTVGEVFGDLDPATASSQARKLSLLTRNAAVPGNDSHEDEDCPPNCSQHSSPGLSSTRRRFSERRMSWRQAIFTRVVTAGALDYTPRHDSIVEDSHNADEEASNGAAGSVAQRTVSTCNGTVSSLDSFQSSMESMEAMRSSEYYRSVWRKAILDQVMTVRVGRTSTSDDSYEPVKEGSLVELRLVYTESPECQSQQCFQGWQELLKCNPRGLSPEDLWSSVTGGVPRQLRGRVWKFLVSVWSLQNQASTDLDEVPNYTYDAFREQESSYQHTILIDLNRTFPHHPYFAQSCGVGQLSLFNVLKAYSLLDREVGYCQGLSFVAGLLLLHFDEAEAFDMLVHLMYKVGFRKQYQTDMFTLRVEMYQLSRLIHDHHKDLYNHFEQFDVPSVFAAPWFLTAFASTFPIGFVARVLDFIFLSGSFDILFKVALVLLGGHKELIKNSDSFEGINDFIKSTLPCMSLIQSERVFQEIAKLDLRRELLCYEVEYNVIQEEVLTTDERGDSPSVTMDSDTAFDNERLKSANQTLRKENSDLLKRLQRSEETCAEVRRSRAELEEKLHSAETTIASIQFKVASLESRIETLEFERRSLLNSMATKH